MAYYVFDGANNRYDSMTKEQILSAITSAIETHSISNVDTGFVTTLKEQNNQTGLKFWVGTQAEYNALVSSHSLEGDTFYIIGDDTTIDDLQAAIAELQTSFSEIGSTITTMQGNISDNASALSTLQTTIVPVSHGGTGATGKANARLNLGIHTSGEINIEFPANTNELELEIDFVDGYIANGALSTFIWGQIRSYKGLANDTADPNNYAASCICTHKVALGTTGEKLYVTIKYVGNETRQDSFIFGLNILYFA